MGPMPPPEESSRLARPGGHTIAYHRLPGKSPEVLFCGGFKSDMTGVKATSLAGHCQRRGQGFTRFDYLGHGQSSGRFVDGTIGRWVDDAIAVIDQVTAGPQVVVGSSMGGWIALLAALARPGRTAALVVLAPAPDFTERLLWAQFDWATREKLARDGVHDMPSDYGADPYPIAYELIREGRRHLLLDKSIPIQCPVRILHGMRDADVPWQMSLELVAALQSRDVAVTFLKDSDHRLSEPADIARMLATVDEVCGAA
jgi:pimeloyl-ACP methyl ester carboxylesterase